MAKKPTTQSFFINASVKHAIFVNRFAGGQLKEMLPYLQDVKKAAAGALAGGELTEFSRTRSLALYAELTSVTQAVYDKMGVALTDNMDEFAKYEAEFYSKVYNKGTNAAADFVLPASNLIEAAIFTNTFKIAGETSTVGDLVSSFSTAKSEQILKTVKQGVIAGKTNEDIIRDIKQVTDVTQAANLRALVATITGQISRTSRDLVTDQNADIITGRQWVATLDSSCCEECGMMDGEIYPPDELPDKPHFACRCTDVPIVDPQYDITQGVQLERASVGDQGGEPVDADLTYKNWLPQQSPAFIKEALGATKAELMVNGGYQLKDFVDQNYKPYSIADLKEKDPMVFDELDL